MMRISEAFFGMAKRAELERRQKPVITMPREALADLARALEIDTGASALYPQPYNGFKFAGIEFKYV